MAVKSIKDKPYKYIEQWLAAIIESSDEAFMSKDLNGIIMSWNKGAEKLFGYTAEEIVGKPVTLLISPETQSEEPEILERIKRGETVGTYETVRLHKNGTLIEVSLKVSPIKMRSGQIVGASSIMHDISERKRAQERQELLLREMGHRVTNVLAVASGLVALSAASATDPKVMAKALQERLTAFTRAHELTRPGLMGGGFVQSQHTTLHKLIEVIVAPYADFDRIAERSCVEVAGDDVEINGAAVTGLALVLHEFTTNAAKYGALSTPEGTVTILCELSDMDLAMTWTELGGPSIDGPPVKGGFGSVLAQRTVKGQFCGEISQDWDAAGLVIRMRLPLARLS